MVEIAKLLASGGADIHAISGKFDTPLSLAAYSGHDLVVMLLLDLGAEVDSAGEQADTPLTLAICNNHTVVSMVLLSRGAQVVPIIEDFSCPVCRLDRGFASPTTLRHAQVKEQSDGVLRSGRLLFYTCLSRYYRCLVSRCPSS